MNTRNTETRPVFDVGDDVLFKLRNGEPWRIGTVADLGFDLIRDEPFVILTDKPHRLYESDVEYVTRIG